MSDPASQEIGNLLREKVILMSKLTQAENDFLQMKREYIDAENGLRAQQVSESSIRSLEIATRDIRDRLRRIDSRLDQLGPTRP